jgi:hypothetical protein
VVGAGEEVHDLLLDVEALLGDEEPHRAAGDGCGVAIEFHQLSLLIGYQ